MIVWTNDGFLLPEELVSKTHGVFYFKQLINHLKVVSIWYFWRQKLFQCVAVVFTLVVCSIWGYIPIIPLLASQVNWPQQTDREAMISLHDFMTDFVRVISSLSEGLGKMALGIVKIYLGSPFSANWRCSWSVCSRSVCRGQLSWSHCWCMLVFRLFQILLALVWFFTLFCPTIGIKRAFRSNVFCSVLQKKFDRFDD